MKTILVDAVNTLFVPTDDGHAVYEPLRAMLDTFANPKILVTNANDDQMVAFGLHASPYPVFTMKHAPDKPDLVYFQTLLRTYDLTAADLLYFEHNPDAVKSARSVGITAHWYDKDARDVAGVQAFLQAHL